MTASAAFLAVLEGAESPPLYWSLPMEHLSAASLGTFQRCPEQFRQRYILGHKEPPNVRLLWGRADHRALEHNWRQKIDSHEDVPVKDVQEAFAAALDEAVEESGGASEVVWDAKPGDVKDAGVKLVSHYHQKASPLVQPVAVERKFELAVAGVPVPLIGYIDLETAGPLVERKTSARAFKIIPGRYALQAGIYQLATRRAVDFHVSVKTKLPNVLTPVDEPGLALAVSDVYLARVEARVLRTVQALVSTYETFGPDEPWPDAIAQDGPCNWCGFRRVCPHWQ